MNGPAELAMTVVCTEPDRSDLESLMPSDSVSQVARRPLQPPSFETSLLDHGTDAHVVPSQEIPRMNSRIAFSLFFHEQFHIIGSFTSTGW